MERHNRGDRHFENHRGGGFSGDPHHHHHSNYHEHQHNHHHNQQDHHHYSNHHDHHSNSHFLNNEPNNPFAGDGFRPNGGDGGHSAPVSGRKRRFHSGRGGSPDFNDRGSSVKLYVASIPRTVTEDDIRPLFEEHGNVVEIVLLKDKRTGHQHGACFVKYAKVEEADRAIKVLHNLQAFPGARDTLIVRYADKEREHFGTLGEKIYIGGLNTQASEKEIEEILSPYGVIEDIYIVCNELKQSRGCGFVKFSNRDMAAAAIHALNGSYTMRGCDRPLIVRFADPKKPRNGDSRVNSAYGGPNFGPRSQEPVTRLGSNLDDPMGEHTLANVSSMSNSSSAGALSKAISHPLQQSPSRLPQNLQDHPQLLMQNLEQKQRSQVTSQQCPRTERYSQSVATTCESAPVLPSNMSTSPAVPKSTLTAAPFDCDWSEHTCPDGCKYYFNCVTCESRWEKPEEYTSFEQLVMKQLKSLSCQQELKPVHGQSSTSPVTACAQQVL